MLKVGVLLGGKSIEREVSFNSGRTICDHLDTQYFQAIPIFQTAQGDLYLLPWSFLCRGKIVDFQHRLEKEAQKISWDDLPKHIDFMYIATHGRYAEDGRLQAILELFKIPYLGTKIFGSSLAMNKQLHNDFLRSHGINVPKGFCLSVDQIKNYDQAYIDQQFKQHSLSFPVVVKPQHEGSSFGVFVVDKKDSLQEIITKSCFITNSIGQGILIEEKIEGMEFTCIIITDDTTGELIALPPTEILIQKDKQIFDYQQKYMPGAVNEKTPASCSQQNIIKIQQTAMQTMKALEFSNMARIDGFLTADDKIIIIDSNPLSGMGPATFLFRQAAEAGIGHAQLINLLIKAELKNYKMTKQVTSKTTPKKIRVAVLFGGASHEKEISLESGRNVCYKLSTEKYDITPIFVDDQMQLHILDTRLLVCTSTREIMYNISKTKKIAWSELPSITDFAFLALHGGQGENGVVQGTLEMLDVPYNGSSIFASSLCMDKYKTGQFLKKHGFDIPDSYLLAKSEWQKNKKGQLEQCLNQFTFPCIVKPHDDGCSVMVSVVHNQKELEQAIHIILQEKQYALIEEKIIGMELTVGVIGNENPQALVPSETVCKKDILSIEEKFLPGAGENQTPARLSQENIQFVQQIIVDAYKAMNCFGCARIDCFFQDEKISKTGKKRVVILECNTLPALTPATCLFHQAAELNMRPMDVLDQIIQLGLQAHKKSEIISVDKALLEQENIIKKQKSNIA